MKQGLEEEKLYHQFNPCRCLKKVLKGVSFTSPVCITHLPMEMGFNVEEIGFVVGRHYIQWKKNIRRLKEG